MREISKQVVFVLFVFSFLKEFCPSCKTAKCFPNQGEPKFGQIRAKSKAALKFDISRLCPETFICSCDFCGLGLGEVKCPYCIEGKDFDSCPKIIFLFGEIGSEFVLKRSHSYYLIVFTVTLLFVPSLKTSLCSWLKKGSLLIIITGKNSCLSFLYFGGSASSLRLWGGGTQESWLCRRTTSEETVTCSNTSSPVSKFHPSRLSIQKVPKVWYCPH